MQSKIENEIIPSFFWDCLTLSNECPFFKSNSSLLYFGIILIGLYSAFLLVMISELKFYWSLDQFQQQIDNCVYFVKKKVKHIQMNQQKLVSVKERTMKQLKRSEESKRMVNMLRGNLTANAGIAGFREPEIENSETDDILEYNDELCDNRLTHK